MGVGGPARILAEAGNEEDLRELLALSQTQKWPLFPLGGGSNVVFGDQGFPGLVVRLGAGFAKMTVTGSTLLAGAATLTSSALKLAQSQGLSGLEPLVGLPGSLGGAVSHNAGGRLGDIGQVVNRLRIMLLDGTIRDIPKADLRFAYRKAQLSLEPGVILAVELTLRPESKEIIEARLAESRALRANQPGGRSAGCVFKNPLQPPNLSEADPTWGLRAGELVSAGRLIDLCGLRGRRLGGAQISPQHANFIVNQGGARATEVLALLDEAQRAVRRRFGLELEPEIARPAVPGGGDD
jgi:UDP-N-acetylmuramate dehydrogenase